jgi:hypothetical protein
MEESFDDVIFHHSGNSPRRNILYPEISFSMESE